MQTDLSRGFIQILIMIPERDIPTALCITVNSAGSLGHSPKVDDLTYTADLLTISYADPVGEEAYEDGIRYIYSEAYGLDQAGTLTLYLPGTRREKLSEDCLSWVSQAMVDENWNPVDELDFVCLYNPAEEEAFYSYNQVDQWLNHLTSCEETEQYYLDELQNLETQGDMTENARNRFRLWDNTLNEEWKILMTLLPEEEKESLRAEGADVDQPQGTGCGRSWSRSGRWFSAAYAGI